VDLLAQALQQCAPDEPGYAALRIAQASLGSADSATGVPPPVPLSHWRERLSGSRVWWDLLIVYSEAAANPDASDRLALAQELLATARELKSSRRIEIALARIARAQLALDDVQATITTVDEWYLTARSAGRWPQASLACVLLAELAWRQHDLPTARRWLADARQMMQYDPTNTLHQSISAHEMAVEALDGEVDESASVLLAMGTETIARCSIFPLLEEITEAGALLARIAGLDQLSRALNESLAQLTRPHNMVPLVLRMRQQALGEAATPALIPQTINAASVRARADLTALHEYFESTGRSVRPS
jgi:hypothetical protein